MVTQCVSCVKEEICGHCENLENESVAKKKKREIASNLNNFFTILFFEHLYFFKE